MALVCGPGVGDPWSRRSLDGTELHQTPYYSIGLQRYQTVHEPSRHSQLGKRANGSQGKHKNKYMGFLRVTEKGKAVTQVEGWQVRWQSLEGWDELFRWTGNQRTGETQVTTEARHRKRSISLLTEERAPPWSFSLPPEPRADVHCSVSWTVKMFPSGAQVVRVCLQLVVKGWGSLSILFRGSDADLAHAQHSPESLHVIPVHLAGQRKLTLPWSSSCLPCPG